jgi:hypothetical protein
MAQVAAGLDENSSEMQQVLTACRELRAATGAMVVLIHHAGKDPGKGARGWSGIKGAVDFEVAISRDGDVREALVSKQKDGEDGERFGFKLVRAPLEGVIDEDGEQVFSCYVEPVELEAPAVKRPTLKGDKAIAYEAAVAACGLAGSAAVEDVIAEAVRRMVPTDGKRDLRRQHAKRALEAVAATGVYLELLDRVVTLHQTHQSAPRCINGAFGAVAPLHQLHHGSLDRGAVVQAARTESAVAALGVSEAQP